MKAEYINHCGTDSLNIAWAVGIIEGEGCLSIFVRKNGLKSCAIHCEMTDEDTVKRLQAALGVGNVTKRAARGIRKPTWILSIQKQKDVFDTLLRIMPNLGMRRLVKAREMFEYLEPIVCR